MSPCLHIITHMDMDMAPCPYIGYGYDSTDLDMGLCSHIITHMDLDMAPCLHIITHVDMVPWIWILSLTLICIWLHVHILLLDLDMAPCLHIIADMDMDMTPCLHICHVKFIIPY